jgi:hypothetical protein
VPGLEKVPADVRTLYLGEFTIEHADAIGRELDVRGIVWWSKEPGFLSRIWEHGVHLFVDRAKLDEARAVAERISNEGI